MMGEAAREKSLGLILKISQVITDYICTENPGQKPTIISINGVNECSVGSALMLANHWLSLMILETTETSADKSRDSFLSIPGEVWAWVIRQQECWLFLLKAHSRSETVNKYLTKNSWVNAFSTYSLCQILGLFSYLRSSQVSRSVHVLCHLHRQAKIHQDCFVWHQHNVAG